MASHRRSGRLAHRSSEGSRIPPLSTPRPSKADRDTAHRSAPAAPKASGLQYQIPQESPRPPVSAQPAGNFRDSIISIVDDPFFRRFDEHVDEGEEEEEGDRDRHGYGDGVEEDEDDASDFDSEPTPRAVGDTRDETTPARRWPPPRRESLTIGHSTFWHQSMPIMESLNIAVIGATGVGKSSFVQRVLGLSRPPISNASSARMVVDNNTYSVTLLELDLEYFDISPSQPIQWPKQINGHIVPHVDGALILYDVMNKESIIELPQTLAALTKSSLPAILVACKCDNPEKTRQIDVQGMANHEFFRSCIGTFNVSSNVPERARACLSAILKAALANRRDAHAAESGVARRRAASATNLDAPDASNGRPLSQHSKHSRASSDLSLLRGFPPSVMPEPHRGQASRSPRLGYPSNPPPNPNAYGVEGAEEEPQPQTVSSMLRTPGIRLDRAPQDSFLDMDESDGESFRYSDDIPILQRNDDNFFEKPAKTLGVTFDELVDRLLAPRMSKADNNFSDVFLCLYRKFAAPGELFSAILTRLDRVRDDKSTHYLSKTATQLRLIEVVAKWVSLYPGDFARPATRRNLEEFIRHLSTEPIFSIAAQQMRRHLEFNVIEDDDTGWAKSDELADKAASKVLLKEKSRPMGDVASDVGNLQLDDDKSGNTRPSGSSDYSSAAPSSSGAGGYFQFHSHEEYEKQAATMEPTDVLPMNKFRYHIFMDTPDDDIADEMTRIDWVMFSSIKIRDFVRHVSLSMEERSKCKSLKNVNRMIHHFNHIAKWVANLILIRDKAKHRAQMLEKFMSIALKLRRLNNYNGLAAVLAGINGTAVHRLSQTWALVGPEVPHSFTKLVILMGTQKSHFAYRLAWENSPLPRIPYIPLHRRDLVTAEEGNRTFVGANGDRINWKKFELLGEVLLPMMKSQGSAYPNLTPNDAARQLILDCRMPTDEEDIYQRSVQVESTSGSAAEQSKKKFPWFAK